MSDRLPRVLVTRAVHQASALGDALGSRGMLVVSIPAIAVEPPLDGYAGLHAALEKLEDFAWVVFTSANAVEVFAREMAELDLEEVPCRVASIGAATSRALRHAGFEVHLQPETAIGEELARSLVPRARGSRMLLIRAEKARDVLPQMLREAGAEVKIAVAYRTVVPESSASRLREELPHLAAITFTSSSSVLNFLELCDAAGVGLPSGIRLASIGPVTSATLREHGFEPTVEAPVADVEVLASTLAKELRTR